MGLTKSSQNSLNRKSNFFEKFHQESRKVGPIRDGEKITLSAPMPQGEDHLKFPSLYHLEVRIGFTRLYEANYRFVFDLARIYFDITPDRFWSRELKIPSGDSGECRVEKVMLVGIGEIAQDTEQWRHIGVLPYEGLDTPYSDFDLIGNIFQSGFRPVVEVASAVADEESDVVYLGGRKVLRPILCDCEDKMVKSGSHVNDAIPDYQRPSFVVGQRSGHMRNKFYAGEILVATNRERMNVIFLPFVDLTLNTFEVFVRTA